jgi:NADP-dependent 3-hydroxy acid dehydrogenase YdfG
MYQMKGFDHQVAVVTGASSGIGAAIAQELGRQGATVCLIGRRVEALTDVVDSIRKYQSASKYYQVDLTSDENIATLQASLQEDFNAVDILIHCAGVFSMGPMETAPIEDFDFQFRINVRAPYSLTQALLPMLKKRAGQIVFVNSTVGLTAKAGLAQYSATKHALKAVADSLRAEVNAHGLRVLTIYPGRTAGPLQQMIHRMEGKLYEPDRLMKPEDVASLLAATLRLNRSAEVTDISVRPTIKPK